jgi:transcriptional regulator with XRE-family HTH domain
MKKIIDLRKEQNLSQRDLADAINITQASISRWEQNQHSINGSNLLKLSKYFNVSIDELLGNELKED